MAACTSRLTGCLQRSHPVVAGLLQRTRGAPLLVARSADGPAVRVVAVRASTTAAQVRRDELSLHACRQHASPHAGGRAVLR